MAPTGTVAHMRPLLRTALRAAAVVGLTMARVAVEGVTAVKEPKEPVVHQYKSWPDTFEAVLTDFKRAELRADDRSVRPEAGDYLVLREWEPEPGIYTGREIYAAITHAARPPMPGIPDGMVLLSIVLLRSDPRDLG